MTNTHLRTVSEKTILLSRENIKLVFKTMSYYMTEKSLWAVLTSLQTKALTNLCKCIFIVLSWVILLSVLVRVTQLQPFFTVRFYAIRLPCQGELSKEAAKAAFQRDDSPPPRCWCHSLHPYLFL